MPLLTRSHALGAAGVLAIAATVAMWGSGERRVRPESPLSAPSPAAEPIAAAPAPAYTDVPQPPEPEPQREPAEQPPAPAAEAEQESREPLRREEWEELACRKLATELKPMIGSDSAKKNIEARQVLQDFAA